MFLSAKSWTMEITFWNVELFLDWSFDIWLVNPASVSPGRLGIA